MIQALLHKTLLGQDGPLNFQVALNIQEGEFICIYGPSGAGKSSLLRMLSGLMPPDEGEIIVNSTTWYNSDYNVNLKPQARDVSFVFQQAALFPNMTVAQNLQFALKNTKQTKHLENLISYAKIDGLLTRKPQSLSGGQKQRVALIRALAQQANVTLLDEPLAALDQSARLALQELIYKLHKETKQTLIMVSHNLAEVIKLADRVYCLDQGKITKQGTPDALFLKSSKSNQISFVGEVLKIDTVANPPELWALLPSGQVKIQVDLATIATLQVGDKIELSTTHFKPDIYKITE